MAEKLAAGKAVTKIPARAAKGAGKSKPRRAASVLKTSEQDKPPKGAAKIGPAAAQPGAAAKAGKKTDAEIRAALADKLLVYTAKHRTLDNRIEALKAELKPVQEELSEVRLAIKNTGFPMDEFDRGLKEAKLRTSRIDLQQREYMRGIIRDTFGLPCGVQPKLDLEGKTPSLPRGAIYWESQGYTAGIVALDYTEASKDVPPEHRPDFDKGFRYGQQRNGDALTRDAAPKPAVAEQAAADFKLDNPDIDLEAAAKKLSKDEAFMKRMDADDYEGVELDELKVAAGVARFMGKEPSEKLLAAIAAAEAGLGDDDPSPGQAEGTEERKEAGAADSDKPAVSPGLDEEAEECAAAALPGDDFQETPAEELAQQSPRRAIQEAKAGVTSGADASELIH